MPQSAVQLKLDRSGRATVFCGISDIGQGADSVLAYIVCEELGLEPGDVRVVAADTDLTPVDLGSYSSRETFMCGNACLDAARTLRRRVTEALAEHWGVSPREVVLAHGVACATGDPQALAMSVRAAFQLAEARLRHAGLGGLVPVPEARRGLSRRHDRGLARVLVHGAHRPGRVRPRDRVRARRRRSGWRTTAAARSRPWPSRVRWRGARTWDAPRRCSKSTCSSRRRPDTARDPSGPEPARLPDPDLARHPGDRGDRHRVGGSRGALRRQGGGRGAAAPERPGDRQRHLTTRSASGATGCRSTRLASCALLDEGGARERWRRPRVPRCAVRPPRPLGLRDADAPHLGMGSPGNGRGSVGAQARARRGGARRRGRHRRRAEHEAPASRTADRRGSRLESRSFGPGARGDDALELGPL